MRSCGKDWADYLGFCQWQRISGYWNLVIAIVFCGYVILLVGTSLFVHVLDLMPKHFYMTSALSRLIARLVEDAAAIQDDGRLWFLSIPFAMWLSSR